MIGELLGSYRITQKLGAGALGVVYLAEHPLIGRKVAIKLLQPEFSSEPEVVARFFNEARATTQIGHPGLVDILDFGHHASGAAYIVMEFLPGDTLGQMIERQGMLPAELLSALAMQIASAVGAAHSRNIVHRDLKPDNVILVPDQSYPFGLKAKVLDFGVAKIAGAEGAAKTRTGHIMGTPMYMAPEQCTGIGLVDHRADVYALGCMMFEMACGRPPFGGNGVWDLLQAHQTRAPARLTMIVPTLPPALEHVIMRALEKRPEHRQQSMDEVVADLNRLTSGRFAQSVSAQPLMQPAPTAASQPTLMDASAVAPPQPIHAPHAQRPQMVSSPAALTIPLGGAGPVQGGHVSQPIAPMAGVRPLGQRVSVPLPAPSTIPSDFGKQKGSSGGAGWILGLVVVLAIAIVRGDTGRRKTVRVAGVRAAALTEAIA